MRKFIVAIVLLLGVIFILTRFTEVQEFGLILHQGRFIFIALAILLEGAWFINFALTFQSLYKLMGIRESTWRLLVLSISANFLSVIAPSGGMSGLAIFLADGSMRGHSSARITVAGIFYILFDYIGLLSVVIFGLVILWIQDNLLWSEILASIVLLLGAVGIIILLSLGARSAEKLGALLAWLAHQANRLSQLLIHRPMLSEDNARFFAAEIAEGISALRGRSHEMVRPILHSLANKALLIGVLSMVFLAFQVPFLAETVIAGFGMGYLFTIVSPTPSGIGFVEGMLTLALTSLGVHIGEATVITVAFRGITFWLPLLVGMIVFRLYTHVQTQKEPIN